MRSGIRKDERLVSGVNGNTRTRRPPTLSNLFQTRGAFLSYILLILIFSIINATHQEKQITESFDEWFERSVVVRY